MIEKEEYAYTVGVKIGGLKKGRDLVLFTPGHCKDIKDNPKIKETILDGIRYIICYNPHKLERDRIERTEIIKNLKKKSALVPLQQS